MSNTENQLVLAALRCTALRVSLIRAEIDNIGIALKSGIIGPTDALAWADEVAPGCLDNVVHSVIKDQQVLA